RLEVHLQLVVVQRPAEITGQPEAPRRPRLQRLVEQLYAADQPLGRLRGHVGPLQQRGRIRPMLGVDRYADRRLHLERERPHLDRTPDLVPQPPGQGHRGGVVRQPQGDRERVAPYPAYERGRRRYLPQPPGHLDQQLVTGGAPQRVVHVPQAGDVQQQYGHHLTGRPNRYRLPQSFTDPAPVGQSGQRVVIGVEPQPLYQSGVLHRHRRVSGDRLQQLDVPWAERGGITDPAGHFQAADRRGTRPQRDHDRVLDAGLGQNRLQGLFPEPGPDRHRLSGLVHPATQRVRRARDVQQGAVVDLGRQQQFRVAATGRHPQGGVFGLQ